MNNVSRNLYCRGHGTRTPSSSSCGLQRFESVLHLNIHLYILKKVAADNSLLANKLEFEHECLQLNIDDNGPNDIDPNGGVVK